MKNRTCDNCGWYTQKFPKCASKNKYFFDNGTCEEWLIEREGFYISILDEEHVRDFLKNGMTIAITESSTIKGARIFGPNNSLIFDQEFEDGPYYYPSGGGTLNLRW